jgi:hypothetical protein
MARLKGELAHDAYLPGMTADERTAVEELWVYRDGFSHVLQERQARGTGIGD